MYGLTQNELILLNFKPKGLIMVFNNKVRELISISDGEISTLISMEKIIVTLDFEEVALAGIYLPKLQATREEILFIRESLILNELLGEEDDLSEQIKCQFYKQMVHGVLWEIRSPKTSTYKMAS